MGRKATDESTVAHPIAKFVIGAFAGVAAISFPRLMAMLAQADSTGEVSYQFFPTGYIIVVTVAAGVMGAVVAIFEFRIPRLPRETFMAALAIPALLAGAFNASSGIAALKESKADAARLLETVQRQSNIPKSDAPTEIFPLENTSTPEPSGRFHFERFLGIATAVADDKVVPSINKPGIGFSVRVEEPRYVVVLEKADSKDDALKRARRLQKTVPNAQATRTATGFYVIQPGAKTESEATHDALNLKKQQLNPSLLRIPATAD